MVEKYFNMGIFAFIYNTGKSSKNREKKNILIVRGK